MKKLRKTIISLLLAVTLVIALVPVTAAQDYIHLPDPNFAAAVREQMGLPEGAPIPRALAAEMTELQVSVGNISSLAGIEYFTALERLDVWGNNLTTLDISRNTALEVLDVSENNLTTLDVSNNPALEWLGVSFNQLTTLDVSNNPLLEQIDAGFNQLTTLDVSRNPLLRLLLVDFNNLTTLDISNNPLLTGLWVYNNNMNSPDDVIGWQDNENLILGQSFIFHPPQDEDRLPMLEDPLMLKIILEQVGASNWAIEEIVEAILLNLIPQDLFFDFEADIRSNITRAEFCRTVVRTLMVKSGYFGDLPQFISTFDIDMAHEPFTDTSAEYIRIAYALGIVTGVGGGRFAPDNPITRQEAAVMLRRAAAVIEPELFFADNPINFADAGDFAVWAREGIDFVSANDIMRGVGENRFNPHGHYTREQSFVTMLRLFNAFPD